MLRAWMDLLRGKNRPRKSRTRPPTRTSRPRLEVLEDRAVPSILFGSSGPRTVGDAGGPVIPHAAVDLIFWGAGWNAAASYRTQITNSVQTIMNSPYLSGLSQYRGVGNGSLLRTDVITSTSPGSTFTDAQVDTFVKNNINNGVLPGPGTSGGQILYMVIPQPGSSTGISSTGRPVGGEHDSDTSNLGRFHYGWTINPSTSYLDGVTYIYSHELTETVTDPEVNYRTAFYVPLTNDEICDGEAQNYSYRLPAAGGGNGVLVQSSLSQATHTYNVYTGQAQNFLVSSARVLTVNGDQLANHNDTITIDAVGGGVRVTLNGETAQFDPFDYFTGQRSVSSITVNSGTGADTVRVTAAAAGFPVSVNSQGPQTFRVNLADGSVVYLTGYHFDLSNDGVLSVSNGSGSYAIDTGVQSFALGSGPVWGNSLIDLHADGVLDQSTGNGLNAVDSGVASFAFGSGPVWGNSLIDLHADGVLDQSTGNGFYAIDTNIRSFVVAANSSVYDLSWDGTLKTSQGSGFYAIDFNVSAFALAYNGTRVYDLQTDGTLHYTDGNGWNTLDTGVQSFVLGPAGYTVDVLEANGNLWQYTGSGPTLLDQGVVGIWLDSSGYTLFAQEGDGTVRQFPA
jgi:hypothetical protein